MSDYIVSILRTIIPSLWGAGLAWLITRVPALEPVRDQLVGLGLILVAVCIGGYYALIRKLEPHLPDWLGRILIGSSRQPALYTSETERQTAARIDGV